MRITIVTVGSRGDVQPYVALGAGLQAAGHSVRLNTHTAYEPLARRHGLDFHKLEGDPRAILEAGRGRFNTLNPLTFWSRLLRAGAPIYRGMAQDVLEASRDADAILYSSLAYFAAYDVARKCGALPLAAYLQPVTPTHHFPMPSSPPLPRWLRFARGPLNRFSFTVGEWLFWLVVRLAVNQMRREMLDLPPLPLRPPYVGAQTAARPVLYGYSPAVLPPPPDWPPHCHVTGYWLLGAEDWTPPEALSRFLEAGPPPVYIGFGSMNSNDAEKTTRIVLEALASAGQRAVLFTGWGALTSQRLPESVLAIDSTPHDWLFPRMAAVVHHGGAGTTAAGLRAGIPSIIIPFMADQPFWAERVQALGVGPAPIPHRRLTADGLAAAVRCAIGDQVMRERAAALGARLRAEDGVGKAVALFEHYAQGA